MATRSMSLVGAGVWIAVLVAVVMASLVPVAANEEGDALMALRHGIKDPDGVLASWDPSLVNPCTWFHVTCNDDNSVDRVELANMRLSGPLPSDLGKLEQLQHSPHQHLQQPTVEAGPGDYDANC